MKPGMILVFSEGGVTARWISKYRPCVPVMVVTSNTQLAHHCQVMFGLYTMMLDKPLSTVKEMKSTVIRALAHAQKVGLCMSGKEVVVLLSNRVTTASGARGKAERQMYITTCPGILDVSQLGTMAPQQGQEVMNVAKTLSLRSTVVDLPMLFESSTVPRKTKIIASLGPVSNNKETIAKLLDAGMDVARFNLAMASMEDVQPVVEMVREVPTTYFTNPSNQISPPPPPPPPPPSAPAALPLCGVYFAWNEHPEHSFPRSSLFWRHVCRWLPRKARHVQFSSTPGGLRSVPLTWLMDLTLATQWTASC